MWDDIDEEDLDDDPGYEDGEGDGDSLQDTIGQAKDTVRGIDEDWKNLKEHRKGGKSKSAEGAEGQAEKQAAKGAEREAAHLAEKDAARAAEKAAVKRAAVSAGARLGAEAALGVATAGIGLILAIPDLIKLLKSKWGKRIILGCCACSGIPSFLSGAIILFLIAIIAGAFGDAGNACPQPEAGRSNIRLPDLSLNVLSPNGSGEPNQKFNYKNAANNQNGDNPCYVSAAKKVEEETNVPWEILAAVDYRQYEHGEDDDLRKDRLTSLDALRDIGRDVQLANRLRDKTTGDLVLDKDGNTINTVTPDVINGVMTPEEPKGTTATGAKKTSDQNDGNASAALSIMSNYRCRFAADQKDWSMQIPGYDKMTGEQKDKFCFEKNFSNDKCDASTGKGCCDLKTHQNCYSGADLIATAWDDDWLTFNIQQQGLVQPPALWDIMKSIPVISQLSTFGGAVWDAGVWMVSQVHNKGYGAVTWYKILMGLPDQCYTSGSNNSTGGGTPGGYTAEGFPDIPYFAQTDGAYAGTRIGPGGCEQISSGGCGVASTAMVLSWYGKNTNPNDIAAAMAGGYYDCNAGISHGMPGAIASQLSGGTMGGTPLGDWNEIKSYLDGSKTGKPVPIIVNSWYAGYGHIVVLMGYKDGNLLINDPIPYWFGSHAWIPEGSFNWGGWGVYVH